MTDDSDEDDSFENEDFNDFSKMSVSRSKPSQRNLLRENKENKNFIDEPFEIVSPSALIRDIAILEKNVAGKYRLDVDRAEEALKLAKYDQNELEKIIKTLKKPIERVLKKSGDLAKCEICCENDVETQKVSGRLCNHNFCLDCWKDYVENNLSTKGYQAAVMECPQHNCGRVLPRHFVQAVLNGDAAASEKYSGFCLDFFAFHSKALIHCLNPACLKYVRQRAETANQSSGECDCGTSFCFGCRAESHKPVSCLNMKEWGKRYASDSLTANYISVNTRTCPKCEVRIEKNSGCNHMKCFSCQFEFCWVCSASWETHGKKTGGFYSCNVYREKNEKKSPKETKNNYLSDSAKFIFFNQRYQNHEHSLRFVQKTLSELESRINSANNKYHWEDYNFLKNAINVVKYCRKILMNTYIYGYFEPEGKNKKLFEFLQQDLESQTEQLHELVEKPFEEANKEKIISLTILAQKYANNLIESLD